MKRDIVQCHRQLQEYICAVERDETDKQALDGVRETFLAVFNQIKLIMISKQERYYGLFLMNFDLQIDFSAYSDAAVSMDTFPFRMTVNPLLIGKKALPEMIYIFCHEIEHIVLNHPVDGVKYNPQKDPAVGYKLNVAMDASINDRLTADSRENGFSTIAEPEEAITSAFLQESLRLHIKPLQAFDYYFERLPDLCKGNTGISRILVTGQRDKDEIITEPKRKGTVCIPCWTVSDDPDEIAGIIRRFVSDACEGMPDDMRSKLPAQQKEALEKLIAPPAITWKQLLKRYVGTIPDGHRKTRLRLSRRQPERYDLSGSINDRIIKLVIAVDTSGSMSEETLRRIMSEIFHIIGARKSEVTIIECDAAVHRVYKVRSPQDVSYDIHGRGGTWFTAAINYVNANRYFRDALLIYFTDGMGEHSIPRPLTLRTMWVLQDERCRLSVRNPYGEVLVMD